MFVILEGENKTGKSSLAKEIQKITGWEIIKFSEPKKEPYIEYVEFLVNRKEPAIIDRFYLGEKAYGPLWRGKSELTEWQTRMIEMLLMTRYSLNIYCETNEQSIIHNFEKEKEEIAKKEQVNSVLHLFRQSIKKSELFWRQFDYEKDSDYKLIKEELQQWLSVYKQNEEYLKNLINTRAIGNPFAKNVIVGDECNGDLELPKYKDIILPFAKGVSSDYLWRAIDNVPKEKYLMTNARKYHFDGHIDMSDILNEKFRKIICLGNNAYYDVKESAKGMLELTKIVKVKHPAWGTKFAIDPQLYSLSIKNELI